MTDQPGKQTIALVSCVKQKAAGARPAKDLYVSPLFRYMRAYAGRNADRWWILSAKYGLVHPDTILEPYEQTLIGAPANVCREWSERVLRQMKEAGLLEPGNTFLWLAGHAYQRQLAEMLREFEQHDPLSGMGIGKRLAWLKAQTSIAR